MKPGDTVSVWRGAFGVPKPYGPTPWDAWANAIVVEVCDDGSIVADRIGYLGHPSKVAREHWREIVPDNA